MTLDLATGRMAGPPTAVKLLGDLASIYGEVDDPGHVVYEIYGEPNQDDLDPPKLLQATTILHPGRANGLPFMTRGHFHKKPERGEICLTLSGSGVLLLVDREGNTKTEPMSPGTISDIDGRRAHRVVNTGDSPLVFFVTWLSDCGHEYGAIPFPEVD
ncbi:glucose-6-phosphate isomerase [bacterium]|nr:MAG: glucose-6-phosphate isomerase [bacterium]